MLNKLIILIIVLCSVLVLAGARQTTRPAVIKQEVVTAGDINHISTSYSWGDHNLVGYLKHEHDPCYSLWLSTFDNNEQDPNSVHLTGNQTIAGVKSGTFDINTTGDVNANRAIFSTQVTTPAIRLTSSTPTTLAGDAHDWDVGNKSFIRASGGTSDRIVTGILASGVADGHVMYITNIGTTNKISFANDSASSAAANRILTSIAGTIEIGPYHTFQIIYDATSSRWRELSHL
jgi:hypothetical protein